MKIIERIGDSDDVREKVITLFKELVEYHSNYYITTEFKVSNQSNYNLSGSIKYEREVILTSEFSKTGKVTSATIIEWVFYVDYNAFYITTKFYSPINGWKTPKEIKYIFNYKRWEGI